MSETSPENYNGSPRIICAKDGGTYTALIIDGNVKCPNCERKYPA